MTNWKASAARISLFPTAAQSQPNAASLYRSVWGREPSNFHSQNLNDQVALSSTAEGRFDGLTSVCSVQPLRIDFTFTGNAGPAFAAPRVVLIDDTANLVGKMRELVVSIGTLTPGFLVSRAACFFQFTRVADTISAANASIAETMPSTYKLQLKDETDLIFQLNHAYPSQALPPFTCNFLTRWSVDRFQLFGVPSAAAPQSSDNPHFAVSLNAITTEIIAANIALDNNNSPGPRPLTLDNTVSILNEMLAATPPKNAVSISVEGLTNG